MTMKEKPRLLILTPIGRYQEPLCRESLDNLAASQKFDLLYSTVIGMSEVSRARNMLCYKAAKILESIDVDAVFWVDSDMVFWPETVMHHYRMLELGVFRAIAGAYSNRFDGRMAASVSKVETARQSLDYEGKTYHFQPVMAGMGALMLDPETFKSYLSSCGRNDKAQEIFACIPTMEADKDEGLVMVSEDYNFCRRLHTTTRAMVYLCRDLQYGHIAQKVLVPSVEEAPVPTAVAL